jgi:hypothetical protein
MTCSQFRAPVEKRYFEDYERAPYMNFHLELEQKMIDTIEKFLPSANSRRDGGEINIRQLTGYSGRVNHPGSETIRCYSGKAC